MDEEVNSVEEVMTVAPADDGDKDGQKGDASQITLGEQLAGQGGAQGGGAHADSAPSVAATPALTPIAPPPPTSPFATDAPFGPGCPYHVDTVQVNVTQCTRIIELSSNRGGLIRSIQCEGGSSVLRTQTLGESRRNP